jgi:arylsulfatase A-like enzyme
VQCFNHGIEFLENNYEADNWLLQIETFDPHEPFTAPMRFRNNYKTNWSGGIRDWPKYGRVEELVDEFNELRSNYFALLELCDEQLGRILDYFDQNGLWEDTGLVVTTDHGFLLGEHDFWAKNRMNMYQEIVHIPFFLYHPNLNQSKECNSLTQTIDICPTILDFFGVNPPTECQGQSLLSVDTKQFNHREAIIYGYFGGAVNVTNGEYTYHRYPFDLMQQEIFQYTLMPTHIRQHFSVDELQHATLNDPFDFSKGIPLLKVPVVQRSPIHKYYGPGCMIENDTRLYNIIDDPKQLKVIEDSKIESIMTEYISQLMKWNQAPIEAFTRLQI